ncbi:hypothetical protein EON67_01420 [archaeon]|nr:MAG: hypothetical protein EON67_01420 [archaeon]
MYASVRVCFHTPLLRACACCRLSGMRVSAVLSCLLFIPHGISCTLVLVRCTRAPVHARRTRRTSARAPPPCKHAQFYIFCTPGVYHPWLRARAVHRAARTSRAVHTITARTMQQHRRGGGGARRRGAPPVLNPLDMRYACTPARGVLLVTKFVTSPCPPCCAHAHGTAPAVLCVYACRGLCRMVVCRPVMGVLREDAVEVLLPDDMLRVGAHPTGRVRACV